MNKQPLALWLALHICRFLSTKCQIYILENGCIVNEEPMVYSTEVSPPPHCPQKSSFHPNVKGVNKKKKEEEKDKKKSISRPMVPPQGTLGKNTPSCSKNPKQVY